MFKGLGNIASLIKQAQSMGTELPAKTEALKSKRVTGTAGGGMVTVIADGLGIVHSIAIDDILREKGDMEMVQDLLPAAINDAMAKAKTLHVEMMQEFTGGMQMPAGMDDMLKQMSGLTGAVEEDEIDYPHENENPGGSK
ncbi:MAG: YbaB/EbfC family nucleoid-associated protein [Mariniblastus sp.]|nr:YbaB/EbfC family nucleoid-associated protein [Mariniblastus sp.]